MKINSIFEKGAGVMNEDQLFIGDNIFAVFDGAGATGFVNFSDKHGNTAGFLASKIVKESFKKNGGTLLDKIENGNNAIRIAMEKENINMSKKENLWCTSVAAVEVVGNTIEYAQITDSLILVIYRDKSFELLTNHDYNHDKENFDAWSRLPKQLSVKEKRNVLSDVFLKVRRGQTSKNPTDEDDFTDFVKDYLKGGLEKVKDNIREKEDSDPNCDIYPRFKKHDDIAAISITL